MDRIIRYIPPFFFFTFICRMIFLADLDQENYIMTISSAVKHGDKIGHFAIYGMMALLLNYALRYRTFRFFNREVFWSTTIVLVFAVTEEFSQLAFKSRTFDLMDVLFDFLGVFLFSHQVTIRFYRKLINRWRILFTSKTTTALVKIHVSPQHRKGSSSQENKWKRDV